MFKECNMSCQKSYFSALALILHFGTFDMNLNYSRHG